MGLSPSSINSDNALTKNAEQRYFGLFFLNYIIVCFHLGLKDFQSFFSIHEIDLSFDKWLMCIRIVLQLSNFRNKWEKSLDSHLK